MVKNTKTAGGRGGKVLSMTGFASHRGAANGHEWTWDMRSVNGKGLDLRLRLPDGIDGLEVAIRTAVGAAVSRGNVTLGLKLARQSGADSLSLNADALQAAIRALQQVEAAAASFNQSLRQTSAAEVLTLRGVIGQSSDAEDMAPLAEALLADLPQLLATFTSMRAAEGAQLAAIIAAQIDRIADLTAASRAAADARRPLMETALKENLARVLAGAPEADPARVAQELAMLTVKADVTEELDRLTAHITAARTLLAEGGPIGRKFDFLMQEFMREANTLCSKSGNADLTRIGLDLKTVIDQMREQVQNVE
jgi:uncharacterized protein (TIGR00255 family)